MNLNAISFVLLPSAAEPSMNFNNSKLALFKSTISRTQEKLKTILTQNFGVKQSVLCIFKKAFFTTTEGFLARWLVESYVR